MLSHACVFANSRLFFRSISQAEPQRMMILDRYLLRHFVQIFVICFLSMTGLFIVIDAFGHLDNFSAHAEQNGSLLGIIAEFYAYRALGIFDRMAGILAMLAAMFTVLWLRRHQEMTAMLAAGIPKVRMLMPLLLAAIVVSLLGLANREWIIPQVRDQLMRETKDLGGMAARALEPRFDSQTDILLGGEKVIVAQRQIVKPTFILPAQLDRYGKQLVAHNATYQDTTATRPAGFLLDGLISPMTITKQPSLSMKISNRQSELDQQEEQVIIITPHDATWLKPDQLYVVSNMPFQLLAGGSKWRSYASTGELVAQLNKPSTDLGADVRVAVHARLVQPLMDVTLVMLGLPLMFSRANRNIFLSIGICLLAAITFSIVAIACQSLGGLGLMRPSLAAWLPLMLFVPLAVMMSHALRT